MSIVASPVLLRLTCAGQTARSWPTKRANLLLAAWRQQRQWPQLAPPTRRRSYLAGGAAVAPLPKLARLPQADHHFHRFARVTRDYHCNGHDNGHPTIRRFSSVAWPAAGSSSSRPKFTRLGQKRPGTAVAGMPSSPGQAMAATPVMSACCQDRTPPGPPPPKKAYIALGSNMGDRIGWIEKACDEMERLGIRVVRTSSLWETEPMYMLEQDKFANGVAEVETDLEPLALLDQLQSIERSLGRQKFIDKGPRNIDLDVLLYGDETVNHERLTVPHIGMVEREFVLRPLAQIAPNITINPKRPWKLVQDYLNELPPQPEPLTPLTPINVSDTDERNPATTLAHPLQALRAARRTRVMAILNVTPDSFSDGGRHYAADASEISFLVETVRNFIKAGATIIDVGGQSTAPGRHEVSVEEELNRVVPVIKGIRSDPDCQGVAISVDTYRAAVAEAAIKAGADMINDVSAGDMDAAMLETVARLGVTVCLMHMRGTPATMSQLNDYSDSDSSDSGSKALETPGKNNKPRDLSSKGTAAQIIEAVARELLQRVEAAEAAGVRRWRIVLDPGLGFAKVGDQNIDVLRHLAELRAWPGLEGLPWLVGSSRKSFIGRTTGVAKPAERVWGTAATVAAAVQGGADIVRVHDVKEMAQVVAMADAIWRY